MTPRTGRPNNDGKARETDVRRSVLILLSAYLLFPATAVAVECGSQTCAAGLFCTCVLEAGVCQGNFVCTSACQSSYTGSPGAGCATDEVCLYPIQDSANEHICGIVQDGGGSTLPTGQLLGGAPCEANGVCQDTCPYAVDGICEDGGPGAVSSACELGSDCSDCGPRDGAPDDSLCRSGECTEVCPGCGYTCRDFCDHSDGTWTPGDPGLSGSCAGTASCTIIQGTTPPSPPRDYQYAVCMPEASPNTGTAATGESCASDPTTCRFGPHSCVDGVCAAPCRLNAHCPNGYYCSLEGTSNGNDTVPVCRAYPGSGGFALPGGDPCLENRDCASNFCEATRRICLDMCTDDASCAAGLVCTGVYVELPGGGPVTFARMCLDGPDPANSTTNPYRRRLAAVPSVSTWLVAALALLLLTWGYCAVGRNASVQR